MEAHRYHNREKRKPFIIRHWFGIIASVLILAIICAGSYTIYYVTENHPIENRTTSALSAPNPVAERLS
ncbi:hypothetical protein [Sporolactobacillus sp. KGMB 08714]|uniref:hypothetical protein n=1 Tax=Sporolactobacillus sp. KGMB 08714 TaxID=3064704 RepID=UPI002FBE9013